MDSGRVCACVAGADARPPASPPRGRPWHPGGQWPVQISVAQGNYCDARRRPPPSRLRNTSPWLISEQADPRAPAHWLTRQNQLAGGLAGRWDVKILSDLFRSDLRCDENFLIAFASPPRLNELAPTGLEPVSRTYSSWAAKYGPHERKCECVNIIGWQKLVQGAKGTPWVGIMSSSSSSSSS